MPSSETTERSLLAPTPKRVARLCDLLRIEPPPETQARVIDEVKRRFLDGSAPPYVWSCDTCRDLGWVDQRAGGVSTSGWATCPDCGNPHGGSQP